MSSESISLVDFQGLVTAPGLLARAKASFIDVRNMLFSAPGVLRKRRGFRRMDGNAGGPIWKLLTSSALGANVLAHVGSGAGIQFRFGDGSAAFTALGPVDSGNLTRTRGQRTELALSQGNHYMTTSEGPVRLESDIGSSPLYYAGVMRGQPTGNLAVSPASGTNIANGFARAYRATWHKLDADGVELGGAPTGRMIVSNRNFASGWTGAAAAATLAVPIQKEWGTLGTAIAADTYFVRLWGGRTYDEANGQVGDDEMYLTSETWVTAADIAAGFVFLTDNTPDDFLLSSPRLHTNALNFPPTEAGIRQGIVNADDPPPVANTIANWQDVVWYGGLTTRPLISLALIAALADGDTVTVSSNGSSTTVTARNAPALATEFKIFTAAPTLSLNIRETTRAMVQCLNLNGISTGFDAYHVATSSTQPGAFLLEQRRVDLTTGLQFSTSVPTKFLSLSGYDVTNSPEVTPQVVSNGLAFSKPIRADAVPPINSFNVGPRDATLLHIEPYQQKLLCFTDRGIYQVTGRTYADFAVFPFELSYRLISSGLVAVCDERVYAWCYEGIIEIDSSGATPISPPIEPTIEELLVRCGGGPSAATSTTKLGWNCLADLGFAVAYRMAHEVRFHFPAADAPSVLNGCADWLSFDTRTRTWTKGRFTSETNYDGYNDSRCCGVVRFIDDLLAMGSWSSGSDTFLFLERREYDPVDFQDTDRSGDSWPVSSSGTIQFQIPDAKGSQHWQQVVFNWDAEEVSWRTLPTLVFIDMQTEHAAVTFGSVDTSGAPMARFEPPREVRRGQRLQVRFRHEQIEYLGIVGIDVSLNSGSRFARTVAS